MGLDINIKGLEREDTYHGGYIRFNLYRKKVASVYNERLDELYEKTFKEDLQPEETGEWNTLCNDDLDIFLWHSDCDGKLTPEECKKIYNELKKLKIKDLPYSDKWTMQELWLNMLQFCYKHRVNMWFH
ncbi:MAG: hypothetical protein ACLSWT_05485 [Clostridia bacterium]